MGCVPIGPSQQEAAEYCKMGKHTTLAVALSLPKQWEEV